MQGNKSKGSSKTIVTLKNVQNKKSGKNKKIQFGAGTKLLKGYINVDLDKRYGADVSCDMDKFPYPFPSNYADEIYCEMTLEHINYPTKAITEFHRILKKGGKAKIIVPHFSGLYALHADIHIRNYGVGYFYGFSSKEVDLWNHKYRMKLWDPVDIQYDSSEVKLLFPKGVLTVLSLPFQLIFGTNRRMQAIYEQFFSNFYRANEIHVTLVK